MTAIVCPGRPRRRGYRMRRRALLLSLGGTAALQPLGAVAQQPKIPVVGFLGIAEPVRSRWWFDAWHKGLAESGYVEGRNLAVEYRFAQGDVTRLPGLAADLVARRVAVIVTTTMQGVTAVRQATRQIPIVFNFISDPVGKGLVKSLARPGGNITGIADQDEDALESKRLQLLREAVPAASRFGYLYAKQDESRRGTIDAVVAAGRTLGVEVVLLTAKTVEEIDHVFATARQRGTGAVLVQSPSALLYAQYKRLLAAAARHGLPVASGLSDFAEEGGLMRYTAGPTEPPYIAGKYVARILKGESPAEMPVQLAVKTQLVLNLKTARALGITFPASLLGNADAVID